MSRLIYPSVLSFWWVPLLTHFLQDPDLYFLLRFQLMVAPRLLASLQCPEFPSRMLQLVSNLNSFSDLTLSKTNGSSLIRCGMQ